MTIEQPFYHSARDVNSSHQDLMPARYSLAVQLFSIAAFTLAFVGWLNETWLFWFENPIWLNRYTEYGIILGFGIWRKVREADTLISQAEKIFTDDELESVKKQFEKMQHHFKNVHLGVGHQSPDYQWWHGQPALDGDLLRIKDSIGELYRLKK